MKIGVRKKVESGHLMKIFPLRVKCFGFHKESCIASHTSAGGCSDIVAGLLSSTPAPEPSEGKFIAIIYWLWHFLTTEHCCSGTLAHC